MKKSASKKKIKFRILILVFLSVLGAVGVAGIGYLFFGPLHIYQRGFQSLDDLTAYAKTINEFIEMENKDFLKPSYETYYKKKFKYTFFQKVGMRAKALMVKVGVAKPPAFSFGYLKKLLENVTKERAAAGWQGEFVQRFTLDPQSKVIVVGVLQGAYHSLVRNLNQMKLLGLLTKDFKFTNEKISLVILGNVVNRSPYTTETLLVILKLMEKNPKQVFYMRGTNEFDYYWVQHTLRRELELGARQLSSEEIPLFKEVSAFFNTLPMEVYGAAYFKKTETELPYVAFSAFVENKELAKKIDEAKYPSFLRENATASLATLDLSKVPAEGAAADKDKAIKNSLKAVMRDIRKRDSFEKMDGLRSLPPEGDAAAWTVLSCPTAPYRVALKYFYDAFAVLSFSEEFEKWKITLYSRHVVENKDFTFSSREEKLLGDVKNGAAKKPAEKVKADASSKAESPKESAQKPPESKVVVSSTEKAPAPAAPQQSEKASAEEDKKKEVKKEPVVVPPAAKQSKEEVAVQKKEAPPFPAVVKQNVVVARPSAAVSAAQLAFYKELTAQLVALKKEVAEVKPAIVKEIQKELQKFEVPDTSTKSAAPVAHGKEAATAASEKAALKTAVSAQNQEERRETQIDAVVNRALNEVKRSWPDIVIHNHVGAPPAAEDKKSKETHEKENAISKQTLEALIATIEALKKELVQGPVDISSSTKTK